MRQINCVPRPVRQPRRPPLGFFALQLNGHPVFPGERTVLSGLNGLAGNRLKVPHAIARRVTLVCGVSIGSQASGYPQGHRK